jgi:hypothetical protein
MPKHVKDKVTQEMRDRVEKYAAVGLTTKQIGAILGMCRGYVGEIFATELERGKAKAIGNVAGKLYELAMRGDKTMIIFYLKTQGEWRETNHHEISGVDGNPIKSITEIKVTLAEPPKKK